jgi:prophage antirepressor-like protein
MNELDFVYSGKNVRVLQINDEPWWIASDVCEVLGLENITMALQKLDSDERDTVVKSEGQSGPDRNIISESGLYTLIIRSNKPEAHAFRRWITHDVLPSIRKTGKFAVKNPVPEGKVVNLFDFNDEPTMVPMIKSKRKIPEVFIADDFVNLRLSEYAFKMLQYKHDDLSQKMGFNHTYSDVILHLIRRDL